MIGSMEKTGAVYTIRVEGTVYGPVELETLGEWAREGRVLPETIIHDTSSEFRFRADEHPFLREEMAKFVPVPPPVPPTQAGPIPNPYTPQGQAQRPIGQATATRATVAQANNKIAAGICAILLGGLGIHKFILGYTGEGIIMLMLTLFGIPLWIMLAAMGLPFLFPPAIMALIGTIEGIIYLSKSDQDFVDTYVRQKKGWF